MNRFVGVITVVFSLVSLPAHSRINQSNLDIAIRGRASVTLNCDGGSVLIRRNVAHVSLGLSLGYGRYTRQEQYAWMAFPVGPKDPVFLLSLFTRDMFVGSLKCYWNN